MNILSILSVSGTVFLKISNMKKVHEIKRISIDKVFLIFEIGNQLIKLRLSEISEKLEHASETERSKFIISPAGYGIHWPLIDEDLSINGLLRVANSGKFAKGFEEVNK